MKVSILPYRYVCTFFEWIFVTLASLFSLVRSKIQQSLIHVRVDGANLDAYNQKLP